MSIAPSPIPATSSPPRRARAPRRVEVKPRGAYLCEERRGHVHFHFLEERNFFIGRAPGCHLRLMRPEISRQHAIVRSHGQAWEIFDCASANGVRVNGEFVRTRVLADGDRIQLGTVELTFHHVQGEPRP